TIPRFNLTADTTDLDVCAGDTGVSSLIIATEELGFDNPVTLSSLATPGFIGNVLLTPNPIDLTTSPANSTLSFDITTPATTGDYVFTIQGVADKEPPDTGTLTRLVDLNISYSAGVTAATTLLIPANTATNVSTNATFSWSPDVNATSYHLLIATDMAFTNIIVDEIVATTSYDAVDLPSTSELYWKVATGSACNVSDVESTVFSFVTESLAGDCPLGVTSVNTVTYDFESGAQGWTHNGIGASPDGWSLSSTNPHSGTQAFYGIEINGLDTVLVSPEIILPTNQSPLTLSFWNRQSMEGRTSGGCYDGGFLEISTDSGATYSAIPTAAMLTDPYDGVINATSNPLNGSDAWCGDPQEYLNSIVDIDAYAGQNVRFRFHKGNDGFIT
ncbi:hypothetical protein MNBD_GAMMA01-1081, partial [hydrothermal vent metagenome]